MTGIDLVISLFLLGCADQPVQPFEEQGYALSAQVYECPLIRTQARFLVLRRVCPIGQPAFLLKDLTTNQGFVRNRFGGVDTAFVSADAFELWLPVCD